MSWNYGNGGRRPKTQKWGVGEKVNVGFLRDLEIAEVYTAPERYTLIGANGAKYEFQPHYGAVRIN